MQQMYLERLSSDDMSVSKYYQDPLFNISKGNIYDLPNCTLYDVCRGNESCGVSSPMKMFSGRSAGGYPEAINFFRDAILPKGSELRHGAFACFGSNSGNMHVAFVERTYDSSHCLITDSRYTEDKSVRNDRYWRKIDNVKLSIGETPIGIPGVGVLQGFVYLPINDIRGRNTQVDQVEVIDDLVNVRKAPEGDLLVSGCFCPMGFYTILETREVNGYKWYKLQDNAWIREGYWTKFHQGVIDDKQQQIDILTKRINDAEIILSGGTL